MAEVYAGLDVSDKSTHVCVMDSSGAAALRGHDTYFSGFANHRSGVVAGA